MLSTYWKVDVIHKRYSKKCFILTYVFHFSQHIQPLTENDREDSVSTKTQI